MTRYMLSVHSCEGEVRQPMSADEEQRCWQQIGRLEAEMKSSGARGSPVGCMNPTRPRSYAQPTARS